ncbi:hypothetical protein RE428_00920 [Marinobacter nanhaiticus D15-8W]|uniref:Uncharacterized protein n=1 Tax=Marinobacter nanhaiticus D15-8W TaxID=626887 RepID=N6W4Z3_9GAMM|nr:hypothetical protein [Marinobacter nanhaiticus]ENO15224.1 hypothetical protein J057_07736 [Marinobacter nanhaiticus D15-8W]BES69074.1 hypothetical protein RE428_00920 [Marinobacter nanhaiticus D15-8W]
MPVSTEISLEQLIESLIGFNKSTLKTLIALMEKLESDLVTLDSGSLQGEAEELLRTILDGITKTMESVLAIQQELQTRIIESFFPAQD